MSTPSGAWGKKLVVRDPTPEELQQTAALRLQRQQEQAARPLNSNADRLADSIESVVTARDGRRQANFIRKISSSSQFRFNVHANAS